jgi:Fe-S cluster biogenesis protein NfuA
MEKEKVEKILKEKVDPFLQRDGGGIELIEITDDNIVKINLKGACATCPMKQMTIVGLVEKILKEEFPTIKKVETK